MEEVSIIGIDLAKRSFQAHGAKADGSVAYRRKLSRGSCWAFSPRSRPLRGTQTALEPTRSRCTRSGKELFEE